MDQAVCLLRLEKNLFLPESELPFWEYTLVQHNHHCYKPKHLPTRNDFLCQACVVLGRVMHKWTKTMANKARKFRNNRKKGFKTNTSENHKKTKFKENQIRLMYDEIWYTNLIATPCFENPNCKVCCAVANPDLRLHVEGEGGGGLVLPSVTSVFFSPKIRGASPRYTTVVDKFPKQQRSMKIIPLWKQHRSTRGYKEFLANKPWWWIMSMWYSHWKKPILLWGISIYCYLHSTSCLVDRNTILKLWRKYVFGIG